MKVSCCNDLKLAAEIPGCDFAITLGSRYKSVNSTLVVVSPTVNDTGEIKCNSDQPPNGHGSSLHIAVGKFYHNFLYNYSSNFNIIIVFTELPLESIDLKRGNSLLLTCEMKAPSDSMVYWTKKLVQNEECQIPTLNDASAELNDTDSILLCNTTAIVSKTVEEVDNNYTIFRLELQVREGCC